MLLWSLYSSTILTKQPGSSLCWLHSVCLEGTRRNFFFQHSLENKVMSHCHTMVLILTLALGTRSQIFGQNSQRPALFFVSIIHVSLVGTPPADFPSPHTQNTDVTATGAGRPGKIIHTLVQIETPTSNENPSQNPLQTSPPNIPKNVGKKEKNRTLEITNRDQEGRTPHPKTNLRMVCVRKHSSHAHPLPQSSVVLDHNTRTVSPTISTSDSTESARTKCLCFFFLPADGATHDLRLPRAITAPEHRCSRLDTGVACLLVSGLGGRRLPAGGLRRAENRIRPALLYSSTTSYTGGLWCGCGGCLILGGRKEIW